jgi:hypothetical protein
MGFPLPLPPRCRESWKRKRAAGAMSPPIVAVLPADCRGCSVSDRRGDTLVGLAEAAGGGKGGEALVEGGGADAAACAQFGEWPRAVDVGERSRDALVGKRESASAGFAVR